MKRQLSEWEKILANYVTDKELISKTYRQLQRTNAREAVEKKECFQTVGGNVSWATTMENRMEVPQKTKNRVAM